MKKKNYSILLVIVMAVGLFLLYTNSNHAIAQTDNGLVTVTKWSFKVNGETEDFGEINLAGTIKANDGVVADRIAPGTEGGFNVVLDGSKSNTAIDYKISMKVVSKPTNMLFYSDSECKNLIPEENGVINVSGSINAEDVNKPLTKTIYWKWAYETGNNEEEIRKNDEIDTKDQGKNAVLKIEVTGMQK